jgi:hypothetical protein
VYLISASQRQHLRAGEKTKKKNTMVLLFKGKGKPVVASMESMNSNSAAVFLGEHAGHRETPQ